MSSERVSPETRKRRVARPNDSAVVLYLRVKRSEKREVGQASGGASAARSEAEIVSEMMPETSRTASMILRTASWDDSPQGPPPSSSSAPSAPASPALPSPSKLRGRSPTAWGDNIHTRHGPKSGTDHSHPQKPLGSRCLCSHGPGPDPPPRAGPNRRFPLTRGTRAGSPGALALPPVAVTHLRWWDGEDALSPPFWSGVLRGWRRGSRREIRGVRVCLRLSSVWAAAAACPP